MIGFLGLKVELRCRQAKQIGAAAFWDVCLMKRVWGVMLTEVIAALKQREGRQLF